MAQYNTGFVWGVYENLAWNYINDLMYRNTICEHLIVGLFSDNLIWRMYDRPVAMPFEERKKYLLSLKCVDNVVMIDKEDFSIEGACNIVSAELNTRVDAFFVGSEYGSLYQEDKKYCEDNNIKILGTDIGPLNVEFLNKALENVYVDYRIVLFGTGKYFEAYMNALGSQYKPIYAIDNDREKWGTKKNGVEIKSPDEIMKESNHDLMVIVCAKNADEMITQLRCMGDYEYRRMNYSNEWAIYDEWRVLLQYEKRHLEKINGLLLELLLEFDRVCKKYNLKYFLNCGSAIGAYRHQGFIPWDDDLDVAMFQWDYDVLRAHADEIWPEGSDYKLVEPMDLGNGAFLDFLNRLMCIREHADTNIFDKVKGKADDYVFNTANLDIYILNNASDNPKKQKRNVMLLKAIYGLGMGHRAFVNYDTYKKFDKWTQFVVRVTSSVGRFMPLSWIIKLHEHFARRFDRQETKGVFESNGYATTFVFDKDIFGEGKRVPVCGHDIMVAEQQERYMYEHGYTNYKEYPPVNCRKPSHAIKSPELV